jgi:hypothetical protein
MQGPLVLPGEYTVQVAAGSRQAKVTVRVEEDPRIQVSEADRKAQLEALLRAGRLLTAIDSGQKSAQSLRTQLATLQESLKRLPAGSESVGKEAAALADKVSRLEARLSRTGGVRQGLGAAGPPPAGTPTPLFQKISRLYGSLGSYTEAPGSEAKERLEALSGELKGLLDQLNQVVEQDVPSLNRLMNQQQVPLIQAGKPVEVRW